MLQMAEMQCYVYNTAVIWSIDNLHELILLRTTLRLLAFPDSISLALHWSVVFGEYVLVLFLILTLSSLDLGLGLESLSFGLGLGYVSLMICECAALTVLYCRLMMLYSLLKLKLWSSLGWWHIVKQVQYVCYFVCQSAGLLYWCVCVCVHSVKHKTRRVFTSNHSHCTLFADILTCLLNNRLADKYTCLNTAYCWLRWLL